MSLEAAVNQGREEIYQVRASLGLLPDPENGKDLTEVPLDLDETFSDVRSAFSELVQTMTQLGLPLASTRATPTKAIAEFHRLDKDGDLDRILRDLIPKVPAVLQARAQLEQARHDLEQAELNLRYCDVVSEIDGVVTSRNVNPGNNVQAGQSLMAVRSLTEIWIDANFKETQLGDLRIGQRVKIEVDMYGSRKEFEGRITGLHHGDRSDARPLAAAERHRQLREDRPAAAGPDRADGLRPGQGAPLRRPVGHALRVLTRNRPRGRMQGKFCNRQPSFRAATELSTSLKRCPDKSCRTATRAIGLGGRIMST